MDIQKWLTFTSAQARVGEFGKNSLPH